MAATRHLKLTLPVQVCELKFGSWTYDGFQVDITNRSAHVDLTNYVFSGEWELIDVQVRRTEVGSELVSSSASLFGPYIVT